MIPTVVTDSARTSAAQFVLRGHVQGVGVRPAVARLATSLSLNGEVSNQTGGVQIHVEGEPARIEEFAKRLPESMPDAAVVEQVTRTLAVPQQATRFQIDVGWSGGPLATHVPRDLAVCKRCVGEFARTDDRRKGYAFTSCTDCGPRYSIIEAMPYERADSSMHEFNLCETCAREFTDPADRRFHAQTNACPTCGPSLWATDQSGKVIEHGGIAIRAAVARLLDGAVIAIKGIGGYQLLCDATSSDALRRLRLRKQRCRKPLAIMLDDDFLNDLPACDRVPLWGPANPIVLVPFACVTGIAEEVAPGLDTVGIMRPTTPLHWPLLQQVARPLVVTSGNIGGEPLAFENTAVEETLGSATELILHHNRRIVRPIDDSVVRVIADRQVTIRCARGIAPLPLGLQAGRPLLAVGGHQKVAVALCNGRQCVLGPHIGDLDSPAARERFVQQTQQLIELYGAEPEAIVHDLHPDYFTTHWAQQQNLPTIAVQHHHAHVVSGMLEHGWLDRTVLGVAFDGTGWGPDGTIWGGEFLLASTENIQRVGSLYPFLLPGGEQAIRQPWRISLALLVEACGVERALQTLSRLVESARLQSIPTLISRQIGLQTSSVGRLFDAISSLVLNVNESSYEGEPAARLEAVCDTATTGEYLFPLRESAEGLQLDWRPLLRDLCKDLASEIPAGTMAMKFHRAVATAVTKVAARYPDHPVVLSGGCFQNRILTELIAERLSQHSQPVGLPGVIPPNDGGLAAGQLAIALAKLRQSSSSGKEISCV